MDERDINAAFEETLRFHAMRPEAARRSLDKIASGRNAAAKVDGLIARLRDVLASAHSPAAKQ